MRPFCNAVFIKIRIPVAKPLQTAERDLPIDPYLYGYWLGNGCATKPEITVCDGDLQAVMANIPYRAYNTIRQPGSVRVYYHKLQKILVPTFRDKVISAAYLRASENQRWELLQGLMDSDGCIGIQKSQSTYGSTIKHLAESVRELLWSLGIKNAMTESPSTRYGESTGETLYTIRFTTFADQTTSKLHRKICRKRERVKKTRSCFHYLENIEPLYGKIPMQCIQVDSTSHCYLAGESFVPTHNLAAAVALLLCCGDGEERADVYGCAADRQLSSTTDITAFVLVFPPMDADDKYAVLPHFWIPEDNIDLRVRRDHVPYDLWERQGFLQTTEGNVVHYGYIEKYIERLGERFNIREIAFDRWGAVQMVQNLEGMGFTVVPFG